MVRIEQWAVIYVSGDDYMPPECRKRALLGSVYGHPSFEDGKVVTTSALIGGSDLAAEGHVVQTDNRQYLLGEPHKSYLAWLEKKGIAFDPKKPISEF